MPTLSMTMTMARLNELGGAITQVY